MNTDALITLIRLHMADPDLSDNLEFYKKKYPGEYRKAAAVQGDDCGTVRGDDCGTVRGDDCGTEHQNCGSAYRRTLRDLQELTVT